MRKRNVRCCSAAGRSHRNSSCSQGSDPPIICGIWASSRGSVTGRREFARSRQGRADVEAARQSWCNSQTNAVRPHRICDAPGVSLRHRPRYRGTLWAPGVRQDEPRSRCSGYRDYAARRTAWSRTALPVHLTAVCRFIWYRSRCSSFEKPRNGTSNVGRSDETGADALQLSFRSGRHRRAAAQLSISARNRQSTRARRVPW